MPENSRIIFDFFPHPIRWSVCSYQTMGRDIVLVGKFFRNSMGSDHLSMSLLQGKKDESCQSAENDTLGEIDNTIR